VDRSLEPKVFLVGRVAIESDGRVVDEGQFPGRQGRLTFAYLVAEQGRAVPRDELAEALWGETPPSTWDKALTGIVSKLRSLLTEQGFDGANALTGAFGCYRLELPQGTWVDVLAATTAVDDAEAALAAGELDTAKDAAALAASVLGQPFLPGEDGSWVEGKRRELADTRARALGALTQASLRSGDASEAVKWAEQTIALAPFRESGYRRLMEAHVAGGDRAEALRVYERCRRLLADELGTYPSPETESIYRTLLEAPQGDGRAEPPFERPTEAAAPDRAPSRRGTRRLAVRLVAVALVTTTAVGAAVVVITRGGPGSAVAGVSSDSVGILDAGTGHPRGQVAVGASPSAVAAGDGSIWVANGDANTVSRIDPKKQVVIETIQVGHDPDGVSFGGGFVWVANSLDGTVSKLDPRTNTQVDVIPVGNGPAGVAVDSRYVWVANSSDGTVTRISLRTDKPLPPISVAQSADGVAVGYGSVWVTNQAAGTVTRIDPRTGRLIEPIRSGSGADAVVTGDDAVWVANNLDSTVTRIDPATDKIVTVIPVGDGPNGIAAVDRAVWVSNELGGTVSKIDPRRNVPVGSVTTGNRPEGVAVDSGSLFVAVRASGIGHSGGTLTFLTSSGDLVHTDPALDYGQLENQVAALAYDGLTGFRRVGGDAGLQLVPDLAASLPAPSDGGRSYSFRLRPGIRYSTGALVRPEDFRRAIERAILLPGPGFYFDDVVGARRCLAEPKRPCDLSRGIVTDPAANTVTFHLTAPDPDFLYELTLPAAAAVPAGTPLHLHGFAPATGPYEIASFDRKRGIRLVRNPRFREWSPAAQPSGFPDEIVERVTGSTDAHILAAVRGSADIASVGLNSKPASPGVLRFVRTHHASQLELNPWDITWYLALNTRIPPFDNLAARQALNFAVDRGRLRGLTVGSGLGSVTCQILPPDLSGHRPYCPYTAEPSNRGAWTAPDLARARRLVKASGTAGEAVTVWIPRIFHQFGATAGKYVVSVLDDTSRYRFATNPFLAEDKLGLQLGFTGWYPDFAIPSSFITPLLTCRSYDRNNALNNNSAEFCSRHIDREIARARRLQTSDPGAASGLWARIDRDLTDQAPWVPYANGVALDVVSTRVGNYQLNPQLGTLLDQLWVR
jgi:YVTN family beta-propeller protein